MWGHPATLRIGAFREVKPFSAIRAEISAVIPPVFQPVSAMTTRPVLAAEERISPSSSGLSERRSTTSASMPSFSRVIAASKASVWPARALVSTAIGSSRPSSRTSAIAPHGLGARLR